MSSNDLESQALVGNDTTEQPDEDKSKKAKKKRKKMSMKERITTFQYCVQCDNIQPPRSSHCDFWGVCILRHDHHCPWVGNCVGYNTHKNFYLFLVYTMFGSIIEVPCYMAGFYFGKCFGPWHECRDFWKF